MSCRSSTDPLGRRWSPPVRGARRGGEYVPVIFVGDDWAESHHDIEIVDDQGRRLARRRLPEVVDGLAGLHALVADQLGDGEDLAEAGDPAQVIVGIETDRGPWVQALVVAGYRVVCGQSGAGGPVSGAAWHVRGQERSGG